MRFNNLNDWLNWQENLNPAEIELGLDRIKRVLTQAKLTTRFNCPLITVAGTNGKGSVVAILESIAISAGLKVCSYTSPHIFHYNERIKCNSQSIKDADLCAAFDRIDQARGAEQLTYFEFGTLAAIDWIGRQEPDLVIMEVGLGGRLDAVNILDSDLGILTSVAIDHVDWLGDDREKIGFEKAGVFRKNKPVICGEYEPPESVTEHARALHCDFVQIGQDFRVINNKNNSWSLQSRFDDIKNLPEPSLIGEFQKSNAATAVVALQSLHKSSLLPSVTEEGLISSLPQALQSIRLAGRFQKIHSQPSVYVDVAHNPHAALSLASQLKKTQSVTQDDTRGQTWAIVAMLSDKDVAGVLNNVCSDIDHWCFADLNNVARALPVQNFLPVLPAALLTEVQDKMDMSESQLNKLQQDLAANQCTILTDTVMLAESIKKACESVLMQVNKRSNKDDQIIIFGSFYTVSEAMTFFSKLHADMLQTDKLHTDLTANIERLN